MDDIRPRGSVEVRCEYPGCSWTFWVDCLDPRLSTGSFDCGADHPRQARISAALARLAAAGLVYQTLVEPPGFGRDRVTQKAGSEPTIVLEPEPSARQGYLALRLREPDFDESQEMWSAGRFAWVVWTSVEDLESLPSDPGAYQWLSLDEAHRNRPAGYTGP